MTKEGYQELLDKHDWWYFNSDSPAVIHAGHLNQLFLKSYWPENEEFITMYKEKSNQIFKPKNNGS